MIRYANSFVFVLMIVVFAGFLLSNSRVVQAYNSTSCPKIQNDPVGLCEDRQYVDTGYYGCSASPSDGCCTYENYDVYCYDGYPILSPVYLGSEQDLDGVDYNSYCDGGFCNNDINI